MIFENKKIILIFGIMSKISWACNISGVEWVTEIMQWWLDGGMLIELYHSKLY